MNLYSLRAPQLGEGIKGIVVTAYLKNRGDLVQKDEPILLVETRKAVMEIESPVAGIVRDFKAPLHKEVPVGSELLDIQIEDDSKSINRDTLRNVFKPHVPISKAEDHIRREQSYVEKSVSTRQHILIKAMRSSSRHVIPAFIQRRMDASTVQKLRKEFRSGLSFGNLIPSSTEIFAWCVLRSMKQNPRFRSVVLDDDKTVQEYKNGSIGIAVGLPNDDLTTVKISDDEYDNFRSFIRICKQRIAEAKNGLDHNGPHFVTISDMSALGVEGSIPVIVAPAIATLSIGIDEGAIQSEKRFTLSLSFDHRLINGAGAASFLSDLKRALDEIKPVIPTA